MVVQVLLKHQLLLLPHCQMLHSLVMFNLDVLLDILLTANNNSSTADYTWNIDNTYTHSGNPVQSTLQVGNYYDITLSVTDNGCFNSATIQDYIYVEDTPQAYFSSSSNSFTELSEEIIFTNSSLEQIHIFGILEMVQVPRYRSNSFICKYDNRVYDIFICIFTIRLSRFY